MSRRVRSSFLWMISTGTAWQVVSWVFTLWTARLLLPTDYGLVALAETVLPYIGLIAALNIPTWVSQTQAFDSKDERSTFTLSLLLGFGLAAIGFALAPLIAAFYDNPDVTRVFRILCIGIVFRGLYTVPESLLRRELRFEPIAVMNLGVGLSRSVLQLVLAYMGYGYWALVVGMVAREVACAVWLIAVRGLPRGFGWDTRLFSRAIGFGVASTGATILWIVYSTIDDVAIGRLFGQGVLGAYTMAFFLSDLPTSKISNVLKPILVPYLAKLRETPEKMHAAFLDIVRGVVYALAPVLIGLGLVAAEGLPLLLGEQWRPAVVPLQVLCVVGLLRALLDYIPAMLLAMNKPGKELYFNLISVILMAPSFWILAYTIGMPGIYITWLVAFPITLIVAMFVLRGVTGITVRRYMGNVGAPVIAVSLMALGVLGLKFALPDLGDVPLLITEIAAGAAIYGAVLWGFFRDDTRAVLRGALRLRS